MPHKVVNVEVKLREREWAEKLIKRFINKCKKEKIIDEVRNREFFISGSQERARKKARRKKVLAKLKRENESTNSNIEKKR